MFEESVRGTVIGPMTWPYEFWTLGSNNPEWDGNYPRCIVKRHFENDREAEEWFKAHYPDDYAQGVEMRCFDKF